MTPFDRQTSIVAPNGGETTMAYDAVGNLLSATNPDGNETIYTYDARGNKTAVTDALRRDDNLRLRQRGPADQGDRPVGPGDAD